MSFNEIQDASLRLPEKARAELAYALLKSLPENGDEFSEEEILETWADEAQRRDDTWDERAARAGEGVLREAREKLKKG